MIELNVIDQALFLIFLLRFQPPGAHEALVDGLFTETRLRTRIQELQAYRAAGLRTFAEADEWEQQRHRQGASRGASSLIGSRGDEVRWGGEQGVAKKVRGWGCIGVRAFGPCS
jgi:hypothetical protein